MVRRPKDTNAVGTNFRTWLKLELDRCNLSQAELARMSDVPQPTIQRIISGETGDPRGSTMAKLRGALDDPSHIELLTTHSTFADIRNVVTDNNMKWNERLKLAREKRGLNKSQMSRLVGVSSATTTDWESGSIKMIDGEHLVKVASVLKVTPEWLIGGTEELPEGFAYENGQTMPFNAPLPSATFERDFLSDFRKLSAAERKIVVRLVRSLVMDK